MQKHSYSGREFTFKKFQNTNDPLFENFISNVPEQFSDLVQRFERSISISGGVSPSVLENRIKLNYFITKFHNEAGTLTSAVTDAIDRLGKRKTIILACAHQPNLFAYGGVFKKMLLLQSLKENLEEHSNRTGICVNIINLFVIVDHDFMDEEWVRRAQMPSIHHSDGIMELHFHVNHRSRKRLICNEPRPSRTVLEQWRKQIRTWIKRSAKYLAYSDDDVTHLLQRFYDFWEQVLEAYSNAESYADLNSFLISKVVNHSMGYDTLFVRLSEMSPVLKKGYELMLTRNERCSNILRNINEIFNSNCIASNVSSSVYENLQVWMNCTCGSKGPVKIISNHYSGQATLFGKCLSCKRDLKLSVVVDQDGNVIIPNEASKLLSPKAISLILLLFHQLGIQCYSAGTGSIDYLIYSSILQQELISESNIPLVVFWPAKDIYEGIGQKAALQSLKAEDREKGEAVYEGLKKKNEQSAEIISSLIKLRSYKVKRGAPIHPILQILFEEKEKQRKIRAKIRSVEIARNALELSPCFIDYAVNFGIREIASQWQQTLKNNDNLFMPYHLSVKS